MERAAVWPKEQKIYFLWTKSYSASLASGGFFKRLPAEWCTFVFTHFLNKDRSKLVLSEEKKNRLGILFSKQNKTSGHRVK